MKYKLAIIKKKLSIIMTISSVRFDLNKNITLPNVSLFIKKFMLYLKLIIKIVFYPKIENIVS